MCKHVWLFVTKNDFQSTCKICGLDSAGLSRENLHDAFMQLLRERQRRFGG